MASPETEKNPWLTLPAVARPTHYDLLVKSDLERLTFTGVVTIHLETIADTAELTLNAGPSLVVSKALVSSDVLKSTTTSLLPLERDIEHERATIKLPHVIPAGSKATVTIAFGAEIDKSMAGYYRSTWEHKGEKGFYALTQFEPTAARKAFPSFDEPALKAAFSISLLHRKGTTALANMPALDAKPVSDSEVEALLRAKELELDIDQVKPPADASLKTEKSEWELTSFDVTPKMSTYLVAFANGPFLHIDSSYTSPLTGKVIDVKVYTTAEYIHQAKFSLEVTTKVMPEYERVFDIPYPLPKLDTLVASDFDAGAMENWGLITGRTSIYLVDEEKGGLSARKLAASVQSHECAHQWFGNITTMASWERQVLSPQLLLFCIGRESAIH